MTAFPAPVYETRPFKIGNQLSHLWWHKVALGYSIASSISFFPRVTPRANDG
jgi:hypothetical protein